MEQQAELVFCYIFTLLLSSCGLLLQKGQLFQKRFHSIPFFLFAKSRSMREDKQAPSAHFVLYTAQSTAFSGGKLGLQTRSPHKGDFKCLSLICFASIEQHVIQHAKPWIEHTPKKFYSWGCRMSCVCLLQGCMQYPYARREVAENIQKEKGLVPLC